MKILDLFKPKTSPKKFSDNPTTAVFTTKFVIEDKHDITYVTHELEDGAWQFFSNDNFENFEEVAKVVGLQQIIDIDNTVLDLADLPLGYSATRNDKTEKWKIHKIK